MGVYRPQYRCRLCGETITSKYTVMEQDDAVNCAKRALSTALYAENPYLGGDKSKGLHNCDDGSIGVADFCGMERKS